MLVSGVVVAESNETVNGTEAGFLHAVHVRHGEERVGQSDGVLNGGAVVCLKGCVVLVDVVLKQRHRLAEDHGLALLAHDHALTGLDTVVGHVTGLGHLFDGVEEVEHVVRGESVLEIIGESVGETGHDAHYVGNVGGGDAGVSEHEAEAVGGGTGLEDLKELFVGPAFGLDLCDVSTGGLEHLTVCAERLDGYVEGQTVGFSFDGHVVHGVLVVVSESVSIHVVGDLNADAQLYERADGGVGNLSDVRSLAGGSHGGQLAVVIVPRGLDDFDVEVGIHLGELSGPLVDVVEVGAGHRGNHNGDGVLCGSGSFLCGSLGLFCCGSLGLLGCGLRAAGAQRKHHDQSQKHCDDLFHCYSPYQNFISSPSPGKDDIVGGKPSRFGFSFSHWQSMYTGDPSVNFTAASIIRCCRTR